MNPFYGSKPEPVEMEEVKNLIRTTTKGLSTTDIADALFNALKNEANTKRLSEFYPREQVEMVRDLMLDGFK